MAHQTGRPGPAVVDTRRQNSGEKKSALETLHENPRGFSFSQAVRLLRSAYGPAGSRGDRFFFENQLRVRPYLSLGFPPTDLVDIVRMGVEEEELPSFKLTATFLGLYGPSSPLPSYYTEELLDEQNNDKSVSRDFLDIFNHVFFILYLLADKHYSLSRMVCEENDPDIIQRLFCLAGLAEPELIQDSLHNQGALLRSIGLLTQFPRSSAGLRGLLADRTGQQVYIHQCSSRLARIPRDQRCCLAENSCSLGRDTWIGTQAHDDQGKIRIIIGPMDADSFILGLPGKPNHDELIMLICFYLTQPLEFDLEAVMLPGEARAARLGENNWSSLGRDTWLNPDPLQETRAIFPDSRRNWDQNRQRRIKL